MGRDKVLDRIVKLLKLAEGRNANQHEAALAAEQAAKMMAEHELEEAEVRVKMEGDGAAESKPEPVVHEAADDTRGYKSIETWRNILAGGVASAFGCRLWWSQGHKVDEKGRWRKHITIKLVGRVSNVNASRYTFAYLEREIERLDKETYWALEDHERPVAAAATAWHNAFRQGAADEVRIRLYNQRNAFEQEMRRAAETSSDKSKALVLVNRGREEVSAYYKNLKKQLGLHSVGGGSRPRNRDAYGQGREAGASIDLGGGRGIGAAPRQLKAVR